MKNIFEEVVHIMHNDYAGWRDKKGWDSPEFFLEKIRTLEEKNELTSDTFTAIIEEYLADFNDKHIYFMDLKSLAQTEKDCGFRVRRFDQRLYVTEVYQETKLSVGMSFHSLGGHTVSQLKEKHTRFLSENHPERENWNKIVSIYKYGELVDAQGNLSHFTFDTFDKPQYNPVYSVKKIQEDVALLTITDFMNPDAIVEMVHDNKSTIESSDYWIIDVRVNYGGSDSSFYPLLPYIMPEKGIDLSKTDEKMLFNCTLDNWEREVQKINEQLKNTEDHNARLFLKVFLREWEKHKGKGFVEFDFKDLLPDLVIKGNPKPKSIVVLSDNKCASSGESFVEICKKSNKVTVMGRATMGLNDYANLTSHKWGDEFELMYPTSRLSRIDNNEGMTGIGIQPHTYIPWTPQHVKEDIDIKSAIEYLRLENHINNI
jgi:C-terminal processing protease CtpA/Prc